MTQLQEEVVREAVAAVFRSAEYSRTPGEIVWEQVRLVIGRILGAIYMMARESPFLFWLAVILVAAIVGAVAWRGAWLARMQRKLAADGYANVSGSADAYRGGDPWARAQRFAADGNYTEAAHMLYRHLLNIIARSERVELHPAKTVGDYARDLRARSSRLFAGYRNFARSYEVVAYSTAGCDRARWDNLLQLAKGVTDPNG